MTQNTNNNSANLNQSKAQSKLNEGLSWTREKIRQLRLRMGWEPSDLARRLNCRCEEILSWEHGEAPIGAQYSSTLDLLHNQAEACAIEMKSVVIAEVMLEDGHTSQIMMSEVVEKHS